MAEGSASCDEVKSVFADFNAQFSGSSSDVMIQDYTCHSREADLITLEGRSVSCVKGDTRLEAMTVYPLGGIPVAEGNYLHRNDRVYFQANGMGCGIGADGTLCQHATPASEVFERGGVFTFMSFGPTVAPNRTGGGGNPGPNPYFEGPQLGAGYSISAFGMSCMNDGSVLTCSDTSGKGFRGNGDDFFETL